MKTILAAALWACAFASLPASADNKLHSADLMDSGQMGLEIAAVSSTYSADYRTPGFNGKLEGSLALIAAEFRYGVTDSWELSAALPYQQEQRKYSGSLFINQTEKFSCYGDPVFGVAFKPVSAANEGIDLVAKLDIQPQSADRSTCGQGYTRKSFDLVVSKPVGDFRPYINLAINKRNKEGINSKAFELGTNWRVSPVLALEMAYELTKYESSATVSSASDNTIVIGADYALKKNIWLVTQFMRQTLKDSQITYLSNYDVTLSDAKQNAILFGVQILY